MLKFYSTFFYPKCNIHDFITFLSLGMDATRSNMLLLLCVIWQSGTDY